MNPIASKDTDKPDYHFLLITLGLLFVRALSEELNVERTDLDFTITPNGHICIFDANPGSSSYSNQLAAMDLMK